MKLLSDTAILRTIVKAGFSGRSLREVLPESLIKSHFNFGKYAAFPGILTGLGLMMTFLAILLALMGVSYNKSNPLEPVHGIDVLINGLSGKFLSSIVALALSVWFTLAERKNESTSPDRVRPNDRCGICVVPTPLVNPYPAGYPASCHKASCFRQPHQ
jgi:hypothetical protein